MDFHHHFLRTCLPFRHRCGQRAALLPTAATAFLNWLFTQPLKTYTQKGRDLRANIDGFKMFLSVTDQNHFAHLSPPGGGAGGGAVSDGR